MADLLPIITINLGFDGGGECSMCGNWRALDHAVAWYCGPTHDEIGSITTEYNDGGTVGGMCVCKECHDRHYAPSPTPEGDE